MAKPFKLERYGWKGSNGGYFVLDHQTHTTQGAATTKRLAVAAAAALNTPKVTAAYHAACAADINHEIKDIAAKAERAIANASVYQQAEGARQLTLPVGRLREILSLARIIEAHYAELATKLEAGEPLATVKTAYSTFL